MRAGCWSISLVESLNNKLRGLNHAHYQIGGSHSTVKKVQHGLLGEMTAKEFDLKIIRTLCNSYQNLNCLEFILSIPII
jgi:hypothetical protein